MKEAMKPVKIKAEAMWACLNRPNQYSGDYQIELTNLSNQAVSVLDELGIVAKKNPQKPEKGFYITCKSKYPIKAYDRDGGEVVDTVGNGSKVVANIMPYSWTFKNTKGVSPSLKKLVITELVRYEAGEDTAADDEEEAL